MCDQLEGRHLRGAKRTIETHSASRTDQDRSLAAALPAFLYARGLYIRDTHVHVLAPTASRAREDAQLYREIDGQLGGRGVGLIHAGQSRTERDAALVRVGPYQSNIGNAYPRVAHLPDPGHGPA
ncbi:hypothetical protein [Streptomyces sp. H72]